MILRFCKQSIKIDPDVNDLTAALVLNNIFLAGIFIAYPAYSTEMTVPQSRVQVFPERAFPLALYLMLPPMAGCGRVTVISIFG